MGRSNNSSVAFLIDFSQTSRATGDVTVSNNVVGLPGSVTQVQGTTVNVSTLTGETIGEVTIHLNFVVCQGSTVTSDVLEVRSTVYVSQGYVATFGDLGQGVATEGGLTGFVTVDIGSVLETNFVTLNVCLTGFNTENILSICLCLVQFSLRTTTRNGRIQTSLNVSVETTINFSSVVVFLQTNLEVRNDVVTRLIEGTTGKDIIQPIPLDAVASETTTKQFSLVNSSKSDEVRIGGLGVACGQGQGDLQTISTRSSEVGRTLCIVQQGGIFRSGNELFGYQETNTVGGFSTVLIQSNSLGIVANNKTINKVGTFGNGEKGTLSDGSTTCRNTNATDAYRSGVVVGVRTLQGLTFNKLGILTRSARGNIVNIERRVIFVRCLSGEGDLSDNTGSNTGQCKTNIILCRGTLRNSSNTNVCGRSRQSELTGHHVVTFLEDAGCQLLNLILLDRLTLGQFTGLDWVPSLIHDPVEVLLRIKVVIVWRHICVSLERHCTMFLF